MLIARGARINATNMGDDTALHLACSHGQKEIAMRVNTCVFVFLMIFYHCEHYLKIFNKFVLMTKQICC